MPRHLIATIRRVFIMDSVEGAAGAVRLCVRAVREAVVFNVDCFD